VNTSLENLEMSGIFDTRHESVRILLSRGKPVSWKSVRKLFIVSCTLWKCGQRSVTLVIFHYSVAADGTGFYASFIMKS